MFLRTAYETEKANDATYFGEPCYYPEKYPLLYGLYEGSDPNDPDYGRSIQLWLVICFIHKEII